MRRFGAATFIGTMTTRILQPGEIEESASTRIPELRLPRNPRLFGERADRLDALAPSSSVGDYLGFLAALARAQQRVFDHLAPPPLDTDRIRQAREAGMPILPARGAQRPAEWQHVLRSLIGALETGAMGAGPQALLQQLAAREETWLDSTAAHILAGEDAAVDAASAPLIAAALQVSWLARAIQLDEQDLGPLLERALCPVCGSHPVCSVVRIGGAEAGFRYLHCALCSTEWHLVRVTCSGCGSTKGIDYREIEGGMGAVKAECCAACNSYLKILYQEKDPMVDPVADDIASLALDLLLDDAGFACSGRNLMLFHGQA
jgi:FdhE protein